MFSHHTPPVPFIALEAAAGFEPTTVCDDDFAYVFAAYDVAASVVCARRLRVHAVNTFRRDFRLLDNLAEGGGQRRSLALPRVRVDVHRQVDSAVASQGLSISGISLRYLVK